MPDSDTISRTAITAFSSYVPKNAQPNGGNLAEFGPTILRALLPSMILPARQTHYGYVEGGGMEIECLGVEMGVPPGFYFSAPGQANIAADPRCRGIVVSAIGHTGFLMTGWLEHSGRLRYIDGCTDSLLIPPIRKGDPCLNLLYFPPHTDQTMHTHPSDRIGMILSGSGACITEGPDGERSDLLSPGLLFCIHAGGRHKFRTTREPMRVLAYHPDSDFGPTDQDHPMINRTMVDGVSASELTEIQTAVG